MVSAKYYEIQKDYTMKLKKSFSAVKSVAFGAALVAGIATTSAYADTFTFSVDTIAPVSISQRQAITFTSALTLLPAGSCKFADLVVTSEWLAAETNLAITPASANGVAVTGSGCADGTSTTSNYGHYLINGADSTAVKITLVSGGADDSSFTFTPQGAVETDPGTAGDSVVIVADTQTTVTLDSSGNAGLLVGGEINIGLTQLTAGTNIAASFDINVVY